LLLRIVGDSEAWHECAIDSTRVETLHATSLHRRVDNGFGLITKRIDL